MTPEQEKEFKPRPKLFQMMEHTEESQTKSEGKPISNFDTNEYMYMNIMLTSYSLNQISVFVFQL